jgi:hypothetical protein
MNRERDLIESLKKCSKALDILVAEGKDDTVSDILTSCEYINEMLRFVIAGMTVCQITELHHEAPAISKECIVQAGALSFGGLVYTHAALTRYNGAWVVAERQGDSLIVSDGLGKRICEMEVCEGE